MSCLQHGWSCLPSDTRPLDYIFSLTDDVLDADAAAAAGAKEIDRGYHSACSSGQIPAGRCVAEYQSYPFYLLTTFHLY